MIETDASKEISKIKTLKSRNEELRTRMDEDFAKFCGDQFSIPVSEGKWENVTSNRAQAEGWKMVNVLTSARRKLFIPGELEDDEKNRDMLAQTEMAVNGLLYSYERSNDGIPESPMLQALMASYRVLRGWGAYRLLVIEDEDGIPYLDLAVWDIRNTFWIPGRNRLLKVYYERYASEEEVKDEYLGFNGKANSKGLVCIYDVWDCSESGKNAKEAVIAGTDYVKEPTFVEVGGRKIDYLPIRIKAGGTTPLIHDDNEDNIKYVGESYLVNTRNLQDVESRLLSYKLTRAGMDAKQPQVILYDSTKGDLPPEFKKDPFVKGSYIFLDIGKGQGLSNPLPMSLGNNISDMLVEIKQMRSQGGLSSVAFGEVDVSMTATGTDILNKNTREHLWSFKQAMEQDYIWMASEIATQFKNGSYKKTEFEGINSKFKRFRTKVKPADVTTDRRFDCELIVDELRDRATNSGMLIQELKAGATSLREGLERYQLSDDPDKSIEMIYQELADQAFDTPIVKGLLAKVEDYAEPNGPKDPKKKFELEWAFYKLLMLLQSGQQSAQPGGGRQLVGQNPVLEANRGKQTARRAQPNIPQPVREAARNAGR